MWSGPEQTCNYEAKLAAAWNLPLVGFRCTDKTMSDKKQYPTFFRTNTAVATVSKSIIAVLKYYGWKRFALFKMDDNDKEGEREWNEIADELEHLSQLERWEISIKVNIKSTWYSYSQSWPEEMGQQVQAAGLVTHSKSFKVHDVSLLGNRLAFLRFSISTS